MGRLQQQQVLQTLLKLLSVCAWRHLPRLLLLLDHWQQPASVATPGNAAEVTAEQHLGACCRRLSWQLTKRCLQHHHLLPPLLLLLPVISEVSPVAAAAAVVVWGQQCWWAAAACLSCC